MPSRPPGSRSYRRSAKSETDALVAKVNAYMDSRRDLPCSWCHVRIRYAGTGDQAFGSLQRMLRVVGNLELHGAHGDLVKRHIVEASAQRRGETIE